MKSYKTCEPKPLFLERMKELLPDKKDFEDYLEILKIPPVRSIRCNTLKISPDKLKKRLENKNWKISQPYKDYPEIMIIKGKYTDKSNNNKLDNELNNNNSNNDKQRLNELSELINSKRRNLEEPVSKQSKSASDSEQLIDLSPGELGRAIEHLLGYYYIQELASMLPILALAPKPNEKILDLCSAPGSKTTQIAARMNNTGMIIANEVKFGRIKILAANLERCGVMNAIITKKDAIALCKRFERNNLISYEPISEDRLIKKNRGFLYFDKILIDAPCSGEGTIRSTPKTLEMWNIKTIENLSKLQKSMVASAISILKPNGELVYSTCTHAPEENEEVIDFILNEFPNMKIEKILLPVKSREGIKTWQNKEYSKEIKLSCRIYPQNNNTEGFFIAKLRKGK